MKMDIGSKKVLVDNSVLLVPDPLPSFDLIGKPKVPKAVKTGMVELMATKG